MLEVSMSQVTTFLLGCVREQIWLPSAPPRSRSAPELCMELTVAVCVLRGAGSCSLPKEEPLEKFCDCRKRGGFCSTTEDATTCQETLPRICFLEGRCWEQPQ